MDNVRTRFAPSPTGYMHIGNLRTALYSYLYAKSEGGKFILRIEDTDKQRYVEDAVDFIYKTLADAGISHDEGPDTGGEFAPYVQSRRKDIYLRQALDLAEKGGAYFCFCEKSDSEDDKEDEHSGYNRKCRGIPYEEALQRVNNGEEYVIRQKMPEEGTTSYIDAVYGEIEVENALLEDQVLIKRDKMPTYNFANVIDDHLMDITHIIRGADFLSSTPKYELLYKSYGWQSPVYAHLPLIMGQNEDGSISKLSKRHGATSFEQLLEQGYLSEAIVNYIALLGWSPKSNDEIFSLDELIKLFTLEGISKSSSVFDYRKLDWVNSQYLAGMDDAVFASKAAEYLNLDKNSYGGKWQFCASLLKSRISKFSEIPERLAFLDSIPDYDSELYINKKNKTSFETSKAVISDLSGILSGTDRWETDVLNETVNSYAQQISQKIGYVMWPFRIAVSGLAVTPGGASEIAYILGKDETLKRLKAALEKLA